MTHAALADRGSITTFLGSDRVSVPDPQGNFRGADGTADFVADWPLDDPTLSAKDSQSPRLRDLTSDQLPKYR